MTHHTLNWFLRRQGKRIYRLTNFKCCRTCDDVYEHGLVVRDELHADYLFTVQGECLYEYADKKRVIKN